MELNLNSLRAKKARMAARVNMIGGKWLVWFGLVIGLVAAIVLLTVNQQRVGFGLMTIALICLILGLWYRKDLSELAPNMPASTIDDIMEAKLLASFRKNAIVTPFSAWQTAIGQWQAKFIVNHLMIAPDLMAQTMSQSPEDMTPVWLATQSLVNNQKTYLHSGILATALILSNNQAKTFLSKNNLNEKDVIETCEWVTRLEKALDEPRPSFGGIGRDWASGFTPMLDRFGTNISAFVEAGHGHFHTLAHGEILDSIVHSLAQTGGAVSLVGTVGTGKTSLVYALAERLLSGQTRELTYFQIISLNASAILSSAGNQLEKIMLNLFAEAVAARNVIIFLDEAALFFGSGPGAFDLSQILSPILQNRNLKIIAAFTPEDWQQLKSKHASLASGMTPVTINEPAHDTVIKILQDTALTLEVQNHITVTYQAVREAYRLSDQYIQEMAYPGKAIRLLEQSIPYCKDKIMTAESVQTAIEVTSGVKVSRAQAPEAEVLLRLEEKIHSRMINQEKAVQVVAAALRRGRAGVANPNRPVGSFLFLGPTGVGKTELARSLAAVYFNDERRMIRLDMTEYSQSDAANRLLETGGPASKSLILQIREQPFSVVLLDEVEKASVAVLNLLLQLLDEGRLSDKNGRPASFSNAIIIATSNAGSAEITQRVAAGDTLDEFERPLIDKLIAQGVFRAELINRFDSIVLFKPLNQKEVFQIAKLMIEKLNQTLSKQNISVQLTDAALTKLVQIGYDPEFGARPMRRAISETVEDVVANKILRGEAQPGSRIVLDDNDLIFAEKLP
jgi:ATP-dependent Clp protease ATP-binding subunit ClpC